MRSVPTPLRWRTFAALAALLLATACGGGFYFGAGSGGNNPPSVSIAASVSSVQAGQSLTLIAAAADDNGIDSVAFYRVDGNTSRLLGTDTGEPYELPTTAPTDGRTTLTVFARATDSDGNTADSSTISITVTQ